MTKINLCPECRTPMDIDGDTIFEHRFVFGDCPKCEYLGIWSPTEWEWLDTTPYQVYLASKCPTRGASNGK